MKLMSGVMEKRITTSSFVSVTLAQAAWTVKRSNMALGSWVPAAMKMAARGSKAMNMAATMRQNTPYSTSHFLILPLRDFSLGAGKKLKGFWSNVVNWAGEYAWYKGKGGGWGRSYDHSRRKTAGIVRWFGAVLMDGVVGGSGGAIKKRFDTKSQCYNAAIANAFKGGYEEWKQTKSVIKLCDNHTD